MLAEILYGNVALRQFSDLDLLIRSRDLPAIKGALSELGYVPRLRFSHAAERAYLESGYEYTFDSAHGRNLVELKWQVLPRFYSIAFEVSSFFDRAVELALEGQRLRTLCDQDLMLVLCVHAAKHGWAHFHCATSSNWRDLDHSTGDSSRQKRAGLELIASSSCHFCWQKNFWEQLHPWGSTCGKIFLRKRSLSEWCIESYPMKSSIRNQSLIFA